MGLGGRIGDYIGFCGAIKGYTTNLVGGRGGQGRKGFACVYITVTINVLIPRPPEYIEKLPFGLYLGF